MINRLKKTSSENNKQTFNIAGQEISSVLNINESYAIAREKFELLRKHCLETLGITKDSPYKDIMNHYLRNGALSFLDASSGNCTKKELNYFKKNYAMFRSVIERIGKLHEVQKKAFLQDMKQHHENDNIEPPENRIVTMDRILSGVEQQKNGPTI